MKSTEEKFAEFVASKRSESNLTQGELAKLAEVSEKSIWNIENAIKTRRSTIDKVLAFFGYKAVETVEIRKVER